MAYRTALFLAMLLISTVSVANSLVIDGLTIKLTTIVGQVVCTAPPSTPPPPPPAPQPLAGINVVVVCDGSAAVLTQALTDLNGFFHLTVETATSLLFDPSRCRVVARLPVARCVFYPDGAILQSALRVVSVLPAAGGVVGALLGNALCVPLPPTVFVN